MSATKDRIIEELSTENARFRATMTLIRLDMLKIVDIIDRELMNPDRIQRRIRNAS